MGAAGTLLPEMGTSSGAYRLARITLLITIGVILWGAFVRVTGSGAGCGSHWPTCHGEILPRAPKTATVIEFTHRVTSGFAFLLVVAQVVSVFRSKTRGHLARRAAAWALFFMITEALVGAGLVLFEKVAHDTSIARGYWMSAHLINTFLLLTAMTVTVWALAPRATPPASTNLSRAAILGAFVLTMIVGVTGAIAALGDTLFPATSLAEGLRQDVAEQAHVFLRLRALHPFAAVFTAMALLWLSSRVGREEGNLAKAGHILGGVVAFQVGLGILNLLLLAPAWMQLCHLLVADVLWMTLVVVACEARVFRGSEATSR